MTPFLVFFIFFNFYLFIFISFLHLVLDFSLFKNFPFTSSVIFLSLSSSFPTPHIPLSSLPSFSYLFFLLSLSLPLLFLFNVFSFSLPLLFPLSLSPHIFFFLLITSFSYIPLVFLFSYLRSVSSLFFSPLLFSLFPFPFSSLTSFPFPLSIAFSFLPLSLL